MQIRLLLHIVTLIAIGMSLSQPASAYRRLTAMEADSLCQTLLYPGETTEEVFEVTGVISGVNRAQKQASHIKAEMAVKGNRFLMLYHLAGKDSAAFNYRSDIGYGDTVTIRTRLQNFKGASSCYYGYLVDVKKYVDPVPQLTRKAKDQEWMLRMETEESEWFSHLMWKVIAISIIFISILLALIRIAHWRMTHDGWTKLHNRFGGRSLTEALLAKKIPGYFCVMDLDHFRELNNEYGQDDGDEYLSLFAKTLKFNFSEHITMRLGGDEFAVFVKETDEEQLREMMNRFFEQVSLIRLKDAPSIRITVSIGATYISTSDTHTFDHLHKAADKACYEAKKTEGNHLIIA